MHRATLLKKKGVLQHRHIEYALSLTTDVAVFLIHVKRGALYIDPAIGRR